MATIVCGNEKCKYQNKSGFCTKECVNLTSFGCCYHWWLANGTFRGGMWDYADIPRSEDVSKQGARNLVKIEPEMKEESFGDIDENAESVDVKSKQNE